MWRGITILLIWFALGMGHAGPVLAASKWPPADAPWQRFEGCRLITHAANDGDSFHVRLPDGTERIFRLYFVDAPETSKRLATRVGEQATYLGLNVAQTVGVGQQASLFSLAHLKAPFTIHTRFQDAKGSSSMPRYFALVELADGYLSESLVRAGLVRIYGMLLDLPDGTSKWAFRGRLLAMEKRARRAGEGAWGVGGAARESKNQVGRRDDSE
jgi:competence protein ComEA